MNLSFHIEHWAAERPFRIAGREWLSFDSVVVELSKDGAVGRGEGLGVFYLGETAVTIAADLDLHAKRIEACADRAELQRLLPPGGARNAVDCALWDLEAKIAGRRIFELTGVSPRPLQSVYTISLDAPQRMAQQAAEAGDYPLLKIKLDGGQPLDCLRAVRAARPDARLVVDANQGWDFELLKGIAPSFADLGVEMIEQPLPRGADQSLQGYRSPVPLGADESCLHAGELDAAAARYQLINIKLDKTGGLTHALELAQAARARGLKLMVGCMGGGSLAMAPSFVIGCLADLVDIDGPLLLKRDRLPGMSYVRARVQPPEAAVWG